MASMYHINSNGDVGVCKAKNRCPFGELEDHYFSKADAMEGAEAENEYRYTEERILNLSYKGPFNDSLVITDFPPLGNIESIQDGIMDFSLDTVFLEERTDYDLRTGESKDYYSIVLKDHFLDISIMNTDSGIIMVFQDDDKNLKENLLEYKEDRVITFNREFLKKLLTAYIPESDPKFKALSNKDTVDVIYLTIADALIEAKEVEELSSLGIDFDEEF